LLDFAFCSSKDDCWFRGHFFLSFLFFVPNVVFEFFLTNLFSFSQKVTHQLGRLLIVIVIRHWKVGCSLLLGSCLLVVHRSLVIRSLVCCGRLLVFVFVHAEFDCWFFGHRFHLAKLIVVFLFSILLFGHLEVDCWFFGLSEGWLLLLFVFFPFLCCSRRLVVLFFILIFFTNKVISFFLHNSLAPHNPCTWLVLLRIWYKIVFLWPLLKRSLWCSHRIAKGINTVYRVKI